MSKIEKNLLGEKMTKKIVMMTKMKETGDTRKDTDSNTTLIIDTEDITTSLTKLKI